MGDRDHRGHEAGREIAPLPDGGVTRREVLARVGKAGLAVAGVGGVSFWLHGREVASGPGDSGPRVWDYRVEGGPGGLVFASGAVDRPEDLLRGVLEALGGLGRFVSRGDRVLIKPNVGWDRNERQAANTNPGLVAALVRACLDAGAARVVVADASCNDPVRAFTRSGVGRAAQEAGAKVIVPGREDFVEVPVGGEVLGRWPVLRALRAADKVIDVPVVKHHSLTKMTCAMKNLYGILGGRRNLLHQRIHQSIFDLANFVRPTLVVVDALRVLFRNGPQGGSFKDVREVGRVAATTDPVLADAWACTHLGLEPGDLGYVRLADGVLGSADLSLVREV